MRLQSLVSPIYSSLNDRTPAALFGFMKVKDMSHKNEVKLLVDVKDKVLKTIDLASESSIYSGFDTEGKLVERKRKMLRKEDIMRVLPAELQRNTLQSGSFNKQRYNGEYGYGTFSIAGGYPRNELLGLPHLKTDVDVICLDDYHSVDMLSMCFKELPSDNTSVKTFQIPDNTMHTIYYPFHIQKRVLDARGRRLPGETMHVFVDPLQFDFTINCGSISTTDGWLYAPPATLHDIEHKILRATVQLADEYHISQLLKLPLLIRTIRFALKYNLEVHNDLYTAMRAYFKLQKERKNMDDKSMYHGLKHLLDDDKSLRDEFYSVFRKLDVFETDKFSTFDEYFAHITERKEKKPRENMLVVGGSRGFTY